MDRIDVPPRASPRRSYIGEMATEIRRRWLGLRRAFSRRTAPSRSAPGGTAASVTVGIPQSSACAWSAAMRRKDESPHAALAASVLPHRCDSQDQIGMIDENTRAIFGRSYAAEPDVLVEQLRTDEAIEAADTLLLTVPNQLGVEYNAHVIENIVTHGHHGCFALDGSRDRIRPKDASQVAACEGQDDDRRRRRRLPLSRNRGRLRDRYRGALETSPLGQPESRDRVVAAWLVRRRSARATQRNGASKRSRGWLCRGGRDSVTGAARKPEGH